MNTRLIHSTLSTARLGLCSLGLVLLLGSAAHAQPSGLPGSHSRSAAPGNSTTVTHDGAAARPTTVPNCGPNGERICTPHGCYCA